MEKSIYCFLWKRFSVKGIYEAKSSGFLKMFLQTIFVSLLLSASIILKLQTNEEAAAEEGMIGSVYISLILLNIVFLLIVSIMALGMNFSSVHKLSFRDFYGVLCYSATIPALAATLAGMLADISLVYLIYNFGLMLFAFYIYKQGQLRERKNASGLEGMD